MLAADETGGLDAVGNAFSYSRGSPSPPATTFRLVQSSAGVIHRQLRLQRVFVDNIQIQDSSLTAIFIAS